MEITFEPIVITKELILSRIPEERILTHYLGLPIRKGLYKSPLRKDERPTCAFYRSRTNNRIMFKDFGNGFCGDFVSIVMCKFNCSYYKALQIIANDFGIINRQDLKINKPKMQYDGTQFEDTGSAVIQVEIREWQQYELDWWAKYGIQLSTLKKFKVFSCKNVFLNGNLFHLEQSNQYVFGYYGGIKQDVEQWRIYFPTKRKYRFISNWKRNQIQGAKQLNKNGGDILVITKSLKDVMALYEYGIQAIAPCSENLFVTDNQYQKLKAKFKNIFLLYDNDLPGIRASIKIHKKYPELNILFIPKSSKCKDFSDYRKTYGDKKTQELIKQAKEFYKL